MKKLICLVLTLMLCAVGATAWAEDIHTLDGLIIEVNEEGVLMETKENGLVLAKLTEATVLEGIRDALELGPDQYVRVSHNGQMTRSIPAQITAEKIAMNRFYATILEISEGMILVLRHDGQGEAQVTLPEGAPALYVGAMVAIYDDGVMSMSLPPLMNALYVSPVTVAGEIVEMEEERFLIRSEDGSQYSVGHDANTMIEGELAVGKDVLAYYDGAMTMSIPAQLFAVALVVQPEV